MLNEAFTYENRVLVVVTTPRHISTQYIPSEREFTIFCRGTICNNLINLYLIAYRDNRTLVDTGSAVTAFESLELVDVIAHFTERILTLIMVKRFTRVYEDLISGNTRNNASACRGYERS